MMKITEKIYLKLFVKDGFAYADHLRSKGGFRHLGKGCYVAPSANIPDPYLTHLGDNSWITHGCSVLCHDASVIMLNRMRNTTYDRIGPVTIKDNCFLGNNVIVLPDTTIESDTIVGAGAVIKGRLDGDSVYAGNPARKLGSLDEYIERIATECANYPWIDLLLRGHTYDAVLENILHQKRISYFFDRD